MENWRNEWEDLFSLEYGYPTWGEMPIYKKELLDLIQQELDKAREEVLTELQEEFSEFGVPDDVRYTKPLFYINEIIEEKLSKLKQ